MTSKFETRIATQKYHGISSADWWKLTDEEQEALIREATICQHCGSTKHKTATCIVPLERKIEIQNAEMAEEYHTYRSDDTLRKILKARCVRLMGDSNPALKAAFADIDSMSRAEMLDLPYFSRA